MVNVMKHNKQSNCWRCRKLGGTGSGGKRRGRCRLHGRQSFGARQYASNFDREELTRAVYFAHMHRVRLYITVNTLVDDAEMPELADYLLFLNNVGVDGIIVQDMGVINLARRLVPQLPLHASTQMTVTSLAGVRLCAENGMERAVLARELSIKDIKTICNSTDTEIEVFIHARYAYATAASA